MKKNQQGLSKNKADKKGNDSLANSLNSESIDKLIVRSRRFINNRLKLANYQLLLKNSAAQ